MTNELDRRAFLRRSALGAAGVAVLGSPLLAACGSSSSSSTSSSSGGSSSSGAAKDFGAYDFQFSWIKNVEFAGMYIADVNGYYKDAGFSSVNFIAGPASPEGIVGDGKQAFIGTSDPTVTAPAILQGAKVIVVAAQYQKSPFCIMSKAASPINKPADMKGKTIGVQAPNTNIFSAFLAANNIKESEVNTVTVDFPTGPFVQGGYDGWFSFVTNEPIEVKFTSGVDTASMLLSDNGLPLVSQHYLVNTDVLKSNRDKVKAALTAEVKGWRDSIKDPTTGAHLAATKYGADLKLDETEQVLESKAQNQLILTDDTRKNGIFTITDALVDQTIASLGKAGTTITKDKLFDLSVINEIYSENAALKVAPA